MHSSDELINELINELADLCGIIPEYWDIFGNKHITPIEAKKAILKAMKLNIDSDEEIKNEIYAQKARPWNRFVEPVKIVSVNDQPLTIPVYIPANEGEEIRLSLSWTIKNETGQKDEFVLSGDAATVSDQYWIDGKRYVKIELKDIGSRGIGYYTINITCKTSEIEITGTSRIIITPDSCYIPQELENGKTWGLSTNLYSIRSLKNWGSGDFCDLKKIVRWISELKGGFVGINPLHAIPNKKPFGISPYSPVSRLYKNFIYLDVESIPEIKELKGQLAIGNRQWEETFKQLRKEDLIDYEKVAAIKEKLLRHAFEVFYEKWITTPPARNARIEEFKRYITEEDENLEYFSTYMALSEQFGVHSSLITHHSSLFSWQEWPEEYRTPSSHTVQEFKKTHEKEILFYQYVQWLIDGQLKEAAEQTGDLGMPVGIYHDLAVGSIGGGSDAWIYQDVVADGIDLGAPPDDFNPTGQNWGFPPLVPEKLKETGYEFFIQIIRKNMQHFGALRIDHALGMFRQFWIPQGMPASQGAYVKYPSEDLLRIIALESVRNRTMVIAEDLGTIGENVRESLFRFRMLSYRLLYFERNYPDPSFLSPDRYPDMALCAVTTHDLPTIYGWWIGRDIEIKKRLGIYPDEDILQRDITNRERDKRLIFEALISHGIISNPPIPPLEKGGEGGFEMTPERCLAIYEYLARTSCKLVAVSLDDAIGTIDQQNMPGITDSYPSWMQKTPIPLEQMLSDKWFSDLSEMFKKNNC